MRIDGASASAGPDRPKLLKVAISASEYEKVFNVIPPDIGGSLCPQWVGLAERPSPGRHRRAKSYHLCCDFYRFAAIRVNSALRGDRQV